MDYGEIAIVQREISTGDSRQDMSFCSLTILISEISVPWVHPLYLCIIL